MTVYCQKAFKLRTIRLTKLDVCGAVVHGPASTVITKGLVDVTLTPTYENPTPYLIRNANDDLEVNEEGQPPLKWYKAAMQFITVDPYAINLTLGYSLVTDESGNVTGWRASEGPSPCFALEGWQNLAGQACSGGNPWVGYRLLPWLLNPQITGDIKMENNVTTFTIEAHTHNLSPWGTGPYNIRNNPNTGLPAPLNTAIGALDHFHNEAVNLAPPTPVCGPVNLP